MIAVTPTGAPGLVDAPDELIDRVYARAFALSVRGETTRASTIELLDLAGGDARILRSTHDRVTHLARAHPNSDHVDRTLTLVTHAWLAAAAAA